MNNKTVLKLMLIVLLVFSASCISETVKKTPLFHIDSFSVDFGELVLNTVSSPEKLTITNFGDGNLIISNVSLTGTGSSDFTMNVVTPITVVPEASTDFEVTFSPSTIGDISAFIAIECNAEGSPATITLTGKGKDPLLPHCDVSPDNFDFGSIVMGNRSTSMTFTISNPGTADLEVASIDIGGTDPTEYTLTQTAPFTVVSQASEVFSVIFYPTSVGVKTATITITHNASSSPDTVTLTGTGLTNETIIFEDDFTSPKAWFYVGDSSHTSSAHWDIYLPPNYTGGTGNYASADSRITPNDVFSEVLVSPNIDCSAFTSGTITLEFDGYYEDNAASVIGDMAAIFNLDVTPTTISVLNTIDIYSSSWGSGQHKVYDITGIALGRSNFAIGFYYYGQNDYWFDIDNVKIIHKP